MGIVSNSLPVKEAIKIAQIKLIEMIIINKNKENNSPSEKGLLFPTKFWLLESFKAPKSVSHNSNDWSEYWLIGFVGRFTDFFKVSFY